MEGHVGKPDLSISTAVLPSTHCSQTHSQRAPLLTCTATQRTFIPAHSELVSVLDKEL